MLGLPHAFGVCGWVLGCCMMVLSAILSSSGLYFLACCATRLREEDPARTKQSFYTIALATLPQATMLIDFAVAIKCFGVGTSYFIVCGDLVPVALEGMGLRGELLLNRHFCIAICFVFGGIALMPQRWLTLTLTLT